MPEAERIQSMPIGDRSFESITIPIIDCSAEPFTAKKNGWTINEHSCMGKLAIDLEKIEMFQLEERNTGYYLLQKLEKLDGKVALNACVLDYLLANHKLIPNSWKGRNNYFPGTVYRSRKGNLCVRYLYFYNGSWRWNYSWLGNNFRSHSQVALYNLT